MIGHRSNGLFSLQRSSSSRRPEGPGTEEKRGKSGGQTGKLAVIPDAARWIQAMSSQIRTQLRLVPPAPQELVQVKKGILLLL
jgi:hypothetical protein